jgi:hypothetical protein
MDEAFQGTAISQEGSLRYRLSGAPELVHCIASYDVTIQVTVTRFVESYNDFTDDPYGYGYGYGCGYGNHCRDREETFSESATSRIELEGLLVG